MFAKLIEDALFRELILFRPDEVCLLFDDSMFSDIFSWLIIIIMCMANELGLPVVLGIMFDSEHIVLLLNLLNKLLLYKQIVYNY
jgi:hypothetical protein